MNSTPYLNIFLETQKYVTYDVFLNVISSESREMRYVAFHCLQLVFIVVFDHRSSLFFANDSQVNIQYQVVLVVSTGDRPLAQKKLPR